MPAVPAGAKKPSDRKKKSTRHGSSWRSPFTDLTLPSGETCQVKRPGIQGLVKAGVLHSLDSLTSIVQTETIPKAEGKPKVNVKAILEDADKFGSMMSMVDKIVVHVVTDPILAPAVRPLVIDGEPVLDEYDKPKFEDIPDDEREDGVIYVDYVDMMDKMYIMNFAVGGSADLAEFRKATSNAVGDVPDLEADEDAS